MLRRRLAALVAFSLVLAAPAVPASPAHASVEATKIQLVLDSSGSMAAPDLAGRPKIEAAREGLHAMIRALEPHVQVGLRVYGATVAVTDPANPPAGACTDTQQVVGIGTDNRAALSSAIDAYRPTGYTPTVQALTAAASDLGTDGKRHVILVSDGIANCSPDPCGEVRALIDSGVTIQIDTVGMSLDEAGRAQLQCIAATAGGTYYDVSSTQDLTTSLTAIAKRVVRGYDFQGTPVSGGSSAQTATPLPTGTFVDNAISGVTTFYRVQRPEGSILELSATSKPRAATGLANLNQTVELHRLDGKSCARSVTGAFDGSGERTLILSNSLVADPGGGFGTAPSCRETTDFILSVTTRFANKGATTPLELVATTRPALAPPRTPDDKSFAGLPPSVDLGSHPIPQPSPGPASVDVVGGTSFNTAARLTPGISADVITIGESLVYEVPLTWGQEATLLVDTDSPTEADVLVKAYGPHRGELPDDVSTDKLESRALLGGGNINTRVGAYVPLVRANNRFADSARIRGAAQPGVHYFVVSISRRADRRADQGVPFPIRLNLLVQGTAGEGDPARLLTGSPTPSSTTTPTASPAATNDRQPLTPAEQPSTSPLRPMVAVAACAVVGAVVVWFVARRRRE